jgi:hypothetical protein
VHLRAITRLIGDAGREEKTAVDSPLAHAIALHLLHEVDTRRPFEPCEFLILQSGISSIKSSRWTEEYEFGRTRVIRQFLKVFEVRRYIATISVCDSISDFVDYSVRVCGGKKIKFERLR